MAVAATNTPYTNWLASSEQQKVAQTQRQWAEAYLRAKTGAAATTDEINNNIRTFFPVVGDSAEVIKQKATARKQAEEAMLAPVGRGADRVPTRNSQPGASSGEAPKPPMLGQVVDGFKFKGGNPADPSSWEQVR